MRGASEIRYGEQIMKTPPPALTESGLKMLVEIWTLQGCPQAWTEKLEFVDIAKVKTYRSPRRGGTVVMDHVLDGGYLDCVNRLDDHDITRTYITAVRVSKRGFEALKNR